MPDQLKLLKQQIQQLETPETDADEEPMD
jgi:hypothetical protein